MKTRTTLALLFCLCLVTGCATSAEFQNGAHLLGTDLGGQAKKYAAADTVVDSTVKTQRVAQADLLLSETAQASTITRGTVATAWANVKTWYSVYIDADAHLSPVEKQLRHETADRLDALILKESQRPFAAP